MKFFFAALLMLFLSACADSHQLMRTAEYHTKLDPSGIVYVSVPRDGFYGQRTYTGSGQNTTQVVVFALSHYAKRVEAGQSYQEFDTSIDTAKKLNAKYLFVPTILEWEDRATEWSGIPDKASIKIIVINVATGATLDSVIIKGKSGLATFGGDHPQDLLPKPVGEYIRYLY